MLRIAARPSLCTDHIRGSTKAKATRALVATVEFEPICEDITQAGDRSLDFVKVGIR